MKNKEISRIFNSIADLLEIKGDNPFRIRAYRRAAQNIEGLPKDAAALSQKELEEIPGIGKDLAEKITEILKTGTLSLYEELKKTVPEGISVIMSVPGLGPKTAKVLYEKFGIKSIEELQKYAKEHRLSEIPGIKKKTEENILKGIETLKRSTGRFPLGSALPIAEGIVNYLKKHAPIKEIEIAGSLRRWKETVRDIDILAISDSPEETMRTFVHMPGVRDVLMKGPTKSSITLEDGIQVDLRVVEKGSFGAALQYFTGSKEHNIKLREMAVKKGLKINEYGIFREKDDKKIGGEKEEDVYRAIGLPYIEPELREDRGEIEAALKGNLPKLVELKDIKGDLHVHSKWSDGNYNIEELIQRAREKGYKYFALTDHSKGLGVARGLSEEKLLEQMRQVDAINKKNKNFVVLIGAEVDIRSDGTLDLSNEILKKLDIVVASIHSGFRQPKEKIMSRLISAMGNPFVSIIAHPSGRLIGEREAYEVDMEALLKKAKETGTIMEINAYPLRLDLNDIYAKRAKELSVPIAISTDTHMLDHFDYMRFGVAIARRGWLEKNNIINTLKLDSLKKILRKNNLK